MKRNRQEKIDPVRRRVIAQLGRFAVYTAPVMTTLLVAPEASANHQGVPHVLPPQACNNPNLPPGAPGCPPVGSTEAGGASTFSGEDFSVEEPAPAAQDSGEGWNEDWNE